MQSTAPRRRNLDGERFDVAVIGGGINGVAIARECARAGRHTLLLEQRDFSSGTTSRSTRIIHGGLRYLEHGEIGLVRESLRERQRLLRAHPHLVRPLTFVLALAPGTRHSALAIRAGLWFYRAFSRQRSGNIGDVFQLEHQLDQGRRWALFAYQDAQCEFPERLVAEWLNEAGNFGTVLRNYATVLGLEAPHGRVRTLIFRDELSGQEQRIEARWIVNASGPWADLVCEQLGVRTPKPMLGGVRGSHIVLPSFDGAPQTAIYSEAADRRPFFAVPWNGQLLVGTTEISDGSNPSAVQPSREEIEYLLHSIRRLLPQHRFEAADIRYAFAGVRPLPYSPGRAEAAVTRRHLVIDHTQDGAAGMVSVIGGKLTTAASLARECVRRIGIAATEPAPALVAPAPANGVEAAFEHWVQQISRGAHIPASSARAITEWHGSHAMQVAHLASQDERLRATLCPHTDHLVAEAIAALQTEHAATLADVLLRRVPVALGGCWSAECSTIAAQRIGRMLVWSEAAIARALESFEEERHAFLQPTVLEQVKTSGKTSLSVASPQGVTQ
jgi:glycerol-3-phosphate dehydrogenase